MKKILLIILLLVIVKIQAQENSEIAAKNVVKFKSGASFKNSLNFDVTYGTTAPMGSYRSYTRAFEGGVDFSRRGFTQETSGQYQFNIDASYTINAFAAGASFGVFNHEISSFNYEIDFPLLLEGGGIKGTYFGIGPEYYMSINKFEVVGILRGGYMNVSVSRLGVSYNGTDTVIPIDIFTSDSNSETKNSLAYASAGLKFAYPIYNGLKLTARVDYFTSFGSGIEVRDTYAPPIDFNSDGNITITDVEDFVLDGNVISETRRLKPQMLNVGIGLQYSFGRKERKYNPNDISNRRGKGEDYAKNAILAYETSGHRITIEQAENMYNNYNTILKPQVEELQKERRQDTSYKATEYAFISIKDLKYYIALLDKVEKMNPDQPDLSGMIIAFGAYNMDYDPNDEDDEVTNIGGDDDSDEVIGRPEKYGDYRGRQTVFFAPTYYDDDPNLIGQDEIFKHRPFYIKRNSESNKYVGTYKPVPFLNFVENTQFGDMHRVTRDFFGKNSVGGPNNNMNMQEFLIYLDSQDTNTGLFFNDLNNMPPKTGTGNGTGNN